MIVNQALGLSHSGALSTGKYESVHKVKVAKSLIYPRFKTAPTTIPFPPAQALQQSAPEVPVLQPCSSN